MDLQTVKTPCLLLDVERLKRNAERMNRIVSTSGVRWKSSTAWCTGFLTTRR